MSTRCVQKVSRILNFRGLRIFDFRFFCGVMLVLMSLIYADKYGHFECSAALLAGVLACFRFLPIPKNGLKNLYQILCEKQN